MPTPPRRSVPSSPSPSVPVSRKSSPRTSPLAMGVVAIVILAALVLGIKGWFGGKDRNGSASSSARTTSLNDVNAIIASVAKHIVIVKQDETPTVATIQDAETLRRQNPTFYKDAKNGDRLLIWSDKAVLYSPSRDILLAVLPITLPASAVGNAAPAATTTASTPVQEQAVIEVRNGSGVAGMGRSMTTKLKDAGLTTLTATDAKVKTPYVKSLIIVEPSKQLPETVKSLQALTGGEVTSAPSGELPQKGDILIIVGQDYTP